MPVFVMVTQVSAESLHQPKSFETLERHVMERVRDDCRDVKWIGNYALLGPWDYLDIFSAPDIDTAMRVSVLVRAYGHAHSEVWPALEWKDFKALAHALPGEGARRPFAESVW